MTVRPGGAQTICARWFTSASRFLLSSKTTLPPWWLCSEVDYTLGSWQTVRWESFDSAGELHWGCSICCNNAALICFHFLFPALIARHAPQVWDSLTPWAWNIWLKGGTDALVELLANLSTHANVDVSSVSPILGFSMIQINRSRLFQKNTKDIVWPESLSSSPPKTQMVDGSSKIWSSVQCLGQSSMTFSFAQVNIFLGNAQQNGAGNAGSQVDMIQDLEGHFSHQ